MHARVSRYTGSADRVEDAIRSFEDTAEKIRELEGFEGAYLLVDRAGGNAVTIALYSSEDAMEATAEQAEQLRRDAADAAGVGAASAEAAFSIESVDMYEVAGLIEPRHEN